VPLAITAQSLFLYGEPSNAGGPFSIEPLAGTPERCMSAHAGRMEELPKAASKFDWLRLIVVVPSPWGGAVHGMPSGLAHILRLVDGHRTGREIYDRLLTDGAIGSDYPPAQFRRHLGLLKRIGTIGFTVKREAWVAPTVEYV
jgi:hypothetical protein